MSKPEVMYEGSLRIREWHRINDEDPIYYVAHLPLVHNHHNLGDCYDVRTSNIVVFPDEKGNFETRNTKYIRVYNKPASEYGLTNETNQDS